jgi:hypothetical protein
MKSSVPRFRTTHGWRQLVALSAGVVALLMIAVPVAIAAPPQHSPADNPVTVFAPGEVCADGIRFENFTLRARQTVFPSAADGSSRMLVRGMGVSRVTDLTTLATYDFTGGFQFNLTFAADGSFRVDAHGRDYVVWYLPGDDSELGAGLFQINGHATEWYAADGAFIRATYSGKATDLCAALAH